MTIAAGFMCRDGVVIAADRQVTAASHYTFQERKFQVLKWKNGRAIWSYSGLHDTMKSVAAEIDTSFALDLTITRDQARARLEKALNASIKKKKEGFWTLFGVSTIGDPPLLLKSAAREVVEVTDCEVIGWGDSSLARYLRGMLLKVPFIPTLEQATIAAIHLVLQAKNYDGQYCGGGTDVFILDAKNRWDPRNGHCADS